MIGHAAVDIVLDMSFLGRIGERFADGYLVAPRDSVDEGFVGTCEEFCYELFVFEGALDEGDIFEGFELLADRRCLLADMGSDFISTLLSASRRLCFGMDGQ